MSIATTQTATLEEFLARPSGPPHFEFEEGELIPVASPTADHQDIVVDLSYVLKKHAMAHNLGRVFTCVDVFLSDELVYIPDISYVSARREDCYSEEDGKIHGSPDLAVEVVSSDSERDRIHKFNVYLEHDVEWYWIIDPEDRTIEEYQSTPEGYVRTAGIAAGQDFQPRLFPGLTINLDLLI